MKQNSAIAPAARLVSFRYMTFDELAAVLGSSRRNAHVLARFHGWSRHLDRHGRARASVPESFLHDLTGATYTRKRNAAAWAAPGAEPRSEVLEKC